MDPKLFPDLMLRECVVSTKHLLTLHGSSYSTHTHQMVDAVSLRKSCCSHTLDWSVQSLKHEDAENIGYVIPTPVIDHFISDYARNGQYTAFPALGIEWQKMESPYMRKALGMKVTHPVYANPCLDRACMGHMECWMNSLCMGPW